MKKYSIPIYWESYKRYEVEAENLQEAALKAVKEFLSEPDSWYIDDSFNIDEIVFENYSEEDLDTNKIYKEL